MEKKMWGLSWIMDIINRANAGSVQYIKANGALCSRHMPLSLKGHFNNGLVWMCFVVWR